MTNDPGTNKPAIRFSRRLRTVREALGWTRKALAEQAGVSDATIRNIEKEWRPAGARTALKLLAAIARRDAGRAQWISEATDAPNGATTVLDENTPKVPLALPPPLQARIIVHRGLTRQLTLTIDWPAASKLFEYLDQRERLDPDFRGLAVTIALEDSEGKGRV